MNTREFERYNKFVEEYYPSTFLNKTKLLKDIYEVIHNNIQFIKILKNVDTQATDERKKLYETYYLLNLRILYHLPSNDSFINGVLIRALVESLLRLSTSILRCQNLSVLDASFSNLKTALEGKGMQHRYKELYDTLCNNFATYSKDVHSENLYRLSEQEFLVSIRNNENVIHLSRILNVHKKINELIIPFCLKEIQIKTKDLSAANLSKLLSAVGDKNYQMFSEK